MDPDPPTQPTVDLEDMQSVTSGRRDRLVRRSLVGAMTVFVLAGALGWFGYRQQTDVSAAHGCDVRISYPERTRGGLAASWQLTVQRSSGEPLPRIHITTTASYFDAFDHHGLDPEPAATGDDGRVVTWTYEPAAGDRLQVTLDMRTQPNARWRHPATTTVLADGATIATFEYRTTVMP